jgi:hypothetical protein
MLYLSQFWLNLDVLGLDVKLTSIPPLQKYKFMMETPVLKPF